MKINPESPNFQKPVDSSTTPSKTGKVFAETLTSKSQPVTGASQTAGKGDVDQAIQQMMDQEFAGLCATDRERVADWLRKDPLVRDALLKRITTSSS